MSGHQTVLEGRSASLFGLMAATNRMLVGSFFPGRIIQITMIAEGRLIDLTVLYDDGDRGYAFVPAQFATPLTAMSAINTSYLIGRVGTVKSVIDDYVDGQSADEVFGDIWVNAEGFYGPEALQPGDDALDNDERITHAPEMAGRPN